MLPYGVAAPYLDLAGDTINHLHPVAGLAWCQPRLYWQVAAYTLECYCAGSYVMTHGVSGSGSDGRGADYSYTDDVGTTSST